MRAIWLQGGELTLREIGVPQPARGEALVSVCRAGVCNTDLELVAGYYPFDGVLGHEFVGIVEQGPDDLVARRVVGEINCVCGRCATCRRGHKTHCERRTVLGIVGRHGAFADYLTLPVENLHRVDDRIPDEVATFVEPLAAALEISEQVTIAADTRVLVVGTGKLGQLILRSLARLGCELVGLGRADPPVADRSFDVAIECTGNAAGFERARRALRPRGTLVMKSTYAGNLSLNTAPIVVDELTLVGSRCGPFAPALQLLADGAVRVDDLIEARYPLGEWRAAFEHAARPGALKVLFEI